MKISRLHPNFPLSNPDAGIQETLRNILIQTNFHPGLRHSLGWRGLKDSSTDVEGWTAKIKSNQGVFGIYFLESESVNGWINGRFGLNYFPEKNEETVELFSLQAGLLTQQEDYFEKLRSFLLYPDFIELFNLGFIDFAINKSAKSFSLQLEANSKLRVIAKDGVSLPKDGKMVQLVEPGGFDQDLPAYEISRNFFDVLAASITFNLDQPPSLLNYFDSPGTITAYSKSGEVNQKLTTELPNSHLSLGWGCSKSMPMLKFYAQTEKVPNSLVSWVEGERLLPEYKNELWWKAHKMDSCESTDGILSGIDRRPHLIVVTGFLGSGKTSFLQNFIEYQTAMNRFVAIIQNEIGEIGLDGKLLNQDYAVTEMDEGCVCCTLVGNLKSAVNDITGKYHPDFIILETTGVANPFNLIDELPEMYEKVRFDSVTTLVDGLNIEESLDDYEIAHEQIKAADVILLNKKDLLTEKKQNELKLKIEKINPKAQILLTSHGDVNPALLYSTDAEENETESSESKKGAELHKHLHTNHHTHEKDKLSATKIEFGKPFEKEQFLRALNSVPKEIFRIKGVIEFDDDKAPMLLQYVAGRYEISRYNHPDSTDRFLVAIGQNLEENFSIGAFY